jgi:hypothetical protein
MHPKQEGMIMIHPTIETLRRLRLTGMAKALEEQQGLPDCDRLSFDERLAMLVDREAVERDNAALAQRLRQARLRQAACLEDVDYRTHPTRSRPQPDPQPRQRPLAARAQQHPDPGPDRYRQEFCRLRSRQPSCP